MRNFKGVFEKSELKPQDDFVCYLDGDEIYSQEISIIEDYDLVYYHKIKVMISDLVIKNINFEKIRIEDWSLVNCENCTVDEIFIDNASRIEYQGTCQRCQVFDATCNLTGSLGHIFMRDNATSKLKLGSDLVVDVKN